MVIKNTDVLSGIDPYDKQTIKSLQPEDKHNIYERPNRNLNSKNHDQLPLFSKDVLPWVSNGSVSNTVKVQSPIGTKTPAYLSTSSKENNTDRLQCMSSVESMSTVLSRSQSGFVNFLEKKSEEPKCDDSSFFISRKSSPAHVLLDQSNLEKTKHDLTPNIHRPPMSPINGNYDETQVPLIPLNLENNFRARSQSSPGPIECRNIGRQTSYFVAKEGGHINTRCDTHNDWSTSTRENKEYTESNTGSQTSSNRQNLHTSHVQFLGQDSTSSIPSPFLPNKTDLWNPSSNKMPTPRLNKDKIEDCTTQGEYSVGGSDLFRANNSSFLPSPQQNRYPEEVFRHPHSSSLAEGRGFLHSSGRNSSGRHHIVSCTNSPLITNRPRSASLNSTLDDVSLRFNSQINQQCFPKHPLNQTFEGQLMNNFNDGQPGLGRTEEIFNLNNVLNKQGSRNQTLDSTNISRFHHYPQQQMQQKMKPLPNQHFRDRSNTMPMQPTFAFNHRSPCHLQSNKKEDLRNNEMDSNSQIGSIKRVNPDLNQENQVYFQPQRNNLPTSVFIPNVGTFYAKGRVPQEKDKFRGDNRDANHSQENFNFNANSNFNIEKNMRSGKFNIGQKDISPTSTVLPHDRNHLSKNQLQNSIPDKPTSLENIDVSTPQALKSDINCRNIEFSGESSNIKNHRCSSTIKEGNGGVVSDQTAISDRLPSSSHSVNCNKNIYRDHGFRGQSFDLEDVDSLKSSNIYRNKPLLSSLNNSSGFDASSPHVFQDGSQNCPKGVYSVKFKMSERNFILGPRASREVKIGSYVKVEADRGEDLGIIVAKIPTEKYNPNCRSSFRLNGNDNSVASDLKKITRLATNNEITLLSEKQEEEDNLLKICREKVRQRCLNMNVVDAEYQYDRHKLTFFFEAEGRVDFRELVRDLFSIYKTRIWMQQLDKGGVAAGYPTISGLPIRERATT
mmetsp:Transcript_10124/g.20336  ORF Transcript_10124/g.20336 Transcript_10124/m.20336 type:complete len:950 (-) Transcript_10124:152-3001(-)